MALTMQVSSPAVRPAVRQRRRPQRSRLLRRRQRTVSRLSSVAVARAAAGPRWRRHVPPALLGLALAWVQRRGAGSRSIGA